MGRWRRRRRRGWARGAEVVLRLGARDLAGFAAALRFTAGLRLAGEARRAAGFARTEARRPDAVASRLLRRPSIRDLLRLVFITHATSLSVERSHFST